MALNAAHPLNSVQPADITLVICLRAHEDNPWVIDRLEALHQYYDPAPNILIIDFGSIGIYRDKIETICRERDFRHAYVADQDVYSISHSRNAALKHVGTRFIFFCDIDFVFVRDFFRDLCRCATAASMHEVFDVVLGMPAYHISKESTHRIETLEDPGLRSEALNRLGFEAQYEAFGENVEFIAPYSNNFLVTREFFDLIGGYNTVFRGHGSEDFEFFCRAAHYSRYLPIPEVLEEDCYGASKSTFFGVKSYRGFRSLNQLFASRSERFGLRAYHMWHPLVNSSAWRKLNDWKRRKLHQALGEYIGDTRRLLSIDGIVREKTALCVCKHPEHWGYMAPLRLHGYKLIPVFDDDPHTLGFVSDLVSSRSIDAYAVFNPYMSSHSEFFPSFLGAKKAGIETIVIERGALPGTVYYSDEVSYGSERFLSNALENLHLSESEKAETKTYIRKLREGSLVLEKSTDRAATARKFRSLDNALKQVIFIPLQLEDDMAVTKFVRKAQSYDDFVAALPEVCRSNQDVLFIVKPHPLSKGEFHRLPENVVIADRSDNVHLLLDYCSAVVCYNSGVGLLAACHGKPLVTVGNAFYNLDGIGQFADSLSDAVTLATARPIAPDEAAVETLVGRYLFHVYSWFTADDDMRETQDRLVHNYRNIQVSRSVLNGIVHGGDWERSRRTFASRNYVVASNNYVVRDLDIGTDFMEMSRPQDVRTMKKNACQAYHDGEYLLAARLFEVAYLRAPSEPNTLRRAAECHFAHGDRRAALLCLKRARIQLKENRRLQARMWTMRFPWLASFIGTHQFDIPIDG